MYVQMQTWMTMATLRSVFLLSVMMFSPFGFCMLRKGSLKYSHNCIFTADF